MALYYRTQWSLDGKTWNTTATTTLTIPITGTKTPPPPSPNYAPTVHVDTTTTPGTAVLTWEDGPSGPPSGYMYARTGTDNTGAGPWVSDLAPATKHTATLDKLVAGGTYTFTVTATTSGANLWPTEVIATIPNTTTPPPSGGTRTEPLAKISRLGFNSIRFDGDPPNQARLTAAGAVRGRDYDGALFFLPRQKWEDFTELGNYGETRALLAAGRIVVTSLPHAPESLGKQINAEGAKDAYRDKQRAIGAFWKSNGMNVPNHVIRPDWEFNGDWYNWSVANGGAAAFAAAFRNFVTNIRAGGADQVLIDLCANQPSSTGATWQTVWPGDEYVDIIGIDQYDLWPASFTQATWDTKQAEVLSMTGASRLAASKGKQWALDEGGNAHDEHGGGDNPLYWGYQRATIDVCRGNLAHHNTFDQAGTGGLDHTLDHNPKSKVAYIREYGSGAPNL